jgi:hypothetical protein
VGTQKGRGRRVLAAAVVAAGIVTAVGASTGAGAETSGSQRPPAVERCRSGQLPDGYADQLDPAREVPPATEPDAERLNLDAARQFGCRFAGVWWDGDGDAARFVIGVVAPTAADQAWLAAADASGEARLEARRVSLVALQHHSERASDVLARRGLTVMVGADQQAGVVTVRARDLPEQAEAALRAEVPAEVLAVRRDPTFSTSLAHSNRDTWNSLLVHAEGGLRIFTEGSCTTGFYVANGFGPFISTAGHCGRVGAAAWAPDNSWQDSIRSNTWYAVGQDQRIDTDAAIASTAAITNYARVMRADGHPSVRSRWSAPNPAIGSTIPIWRTGAQSNNDRSGVVRSDDDFVTFTNARDNTRRLVRVWCISTGTVGGDSGGPVYSFRSDGALHAAGTIVGFQTVNGETRTCFSHVYYTIIRLNVTLQTS